MPRRESRILPRKPGGRGALEGFLRQGPQLYRARQHRRNRKILWLRSCARALMVLAQVTLSAADFPGRQCGPTDSLVIAGVPDLWQGEPDVAAAAAASRIQASRPEDHSRRTEAPLQTTDSVARKLSGQKQPNSAPAGAECGQAHRRRRRRGGQSRSAAAAHSRGPPCPRSPTARSAAPRACRR